MENTQHGTDKIIDDITNQKNILRSKLEEIWYNYDEFSEKSIDIKNDNINQFDIKFGIKELTKILSKLKLVVPDVELLISYLENMQYNPEQYTCWVVCSPEDNNDYIGLCSGFPSLSWIANNYDEAFSGIKTLLKDCIIDMQQNKEPIPDDCLEHIASEILICGHCEGDINGEDIETMHKCDRCERMVCNHMDTGDPSVGIWGGLCIDIICTK